MPNNFHFFTDLDLIQAQIADDAFGPVNGFENSKYRLCSLHSASQDPKAYAICNGTIFVQDHETDPLLVNLVLKPSSQPVIGFPSVKYFLYKGIKKSSLFTTNGSEIASAGTNDLTQSIWDSQNSRNESIDVANEVPIGTTTDTPSSAALGINYSANSVSPYTALDVDELIQVYFSGSSSFQLPFTNGGECIGEFDMNSFGLQIILDTVRYSANFGDVRRFDDVLTIAELSGGESQADIFSHWHQKERILTCIDPAAFFGGFYARGVKAKNSIDTEFTIYKGDNIYSNLLVLFFNKNRVYCDIRGEHDNAFNYQGNLGNYINFSFEINGNFNQIDYYRSNWPILIIDNDFPTGNSNNSNTLRLKLPKGDLENAILIAITASSGETFPENLKGKKRFIGLEYNSISQFAINELIFKTPNYVDTVTTPIANFIHLKYVRHILGTPEINPNSQQKISLNEYDYLFQPFLLKTDWVDNGNTTKIQIFNEERFVDRSKTEKLSFLANLGIGVNADGSKTYFAYSVCKNSSSPVLTKPLVFNGGVFDSNQNTMSCLGQVAGFVNVKSLHFVLGNAEVFDVLDQELETNMDLNQSRNKFNLSDFLYLNLSATDYTILESLAADPLNEFLTDFPISLKFLKISNGLLNEDMRFIKFELVLSGYKVSGGNSIIINEIPTGIEVFKTQSRVGNITNSY